MYVYKMRKVTKFKNKEEENAAIEEVRRVREESEREIANGTAVFPDLPERRDGETIVLFVCREED